MASFLARTAGLGTNPPIVNAKTAQSATTAQSAVTAQTATSATTAQSAVTAQTATNAVNAQNATNATSATNATNATNAVTAQTAINAPNAQPKFVRTVLVGPVGTATANGTALRNAVATIQAASPEPFLLKLKPGTYDLGNATNLALPLFTDIEGSGEGITTITHGGAMQLAAAADTEIRHLTITCAPVGFADCAALRFADGQGLTLSHVTLRASSSTNPVGLQLSSASATVLDSTIATSGGAVIGISATGAGGTTLIIRRTSITLTGGGNQNAISVSGAITLIVEQSRISVSTANFISQSTGATVRVATSMLGGGFLAVPAITPACAAVYNANFVALSATCT